MMTFDVRWESTERLVNPDCDFKCPLCDFVSYKYNFAQDLTSGEIRCPKCKKWSSSSRSVKLKIIDDSNPDDPICECPICGLRQGIWDHGCFELSCQRCKQQFDGAVKY